MESNSNFLESEGFSVIYESSFLTGLLEGELKQPFAINDKLFSFSNKIKTKDWLRIMKLYEKLALSQSDAIEAYSKMGSIQSVKVDTSKMAENLEFFSDSILELAMNNIQYHPKHELETNIPIQLYENVTPERFDELVEGSPEVLMIPKYFMQHIFFLMKKSKLYANNIQKQ